MEIWWHILLYLWNKMKKSFKKVDAWNSMTQTALQKATRNCSFAIRITDKNKRGTDNFLPFCAPLDTNSGSYVFQLLCWHSEFTSLQHDSNIFANFNILMVHIFNVISAFCFGIQLWLEESWRFNAWSRDKTLESWCDHDEYLHNFCTVLKLTKMLKSFWKLVNFLHLCTPSINLKSLFQ